MCNELHTFTPTLPDKILYNNVKTFRGNPEGFRLHLAKEATKKIVNINLLNTIQSLSTKLQEEKSGFQQGLKHASSIHFAIMQDQKTARR